MPPGVPPGDDAHDGAIRIFGVINVLSDRRRFGNAFATRRKLLSGDDGELPNHQPPRTPEPVIEKYNHIFHVTILVCIVYAYVGGKKSNGPSSDSEAIVKGTFICFSRAYTSCFTFSHFHIITCVHSAH